MHFASQHPIRQTEDVFADFDDLRPMRVFTGTPGRDRFTGTTAADSFDLSQGGNDRIHGRGGDDAVFFGAAFSGGDRVDGGDGYDVVTLRGDYSGGVVIGRHSLTHIERLDLQGGSYLVTGVLGFVDSDGFTHVDADALDVGQSLDINVSSIGDLWVRGGRGDDTIRGSSNGVACYLDGAAGDDVIIGGSGANSLAGREGDDILIGGAGRSSFWGGAGADHIATTTSADVIEYFGTSESVEDSYDVIQSFQGRIRLYFDSDTTTDGVQFDFHLGRTEGRAGDIIDRYDADSGDTIVKVFTDADARPDLVFHIVGEIRLTTADFVFGLS